MTLAPRAACVAMLLAVSCAAVAQAPLPSQAALAEQAARRYRQPVRVGDLVGRDVLQPRESQPVLGRVQALTRRPDGGIDMIIRAGAVLGVGSRTVAVPVEAVALLGEHVALTGYSPVQFSGLPTAQPGPGLPPDETIQVALVRPFH